MKQENAKIPLFAVSLELYPKAIEMALKKYVAVVLEDSVRNFPVTEKEREIIGKWVNHLGLPEEFLTDSRIIATVPKEAALVVRSSGSTGRPKRLLLSRSALTSATRATNLYLGATGDWYCALPLNYVAGSMTLVRAVLSGTNYYLLSTNLADLPNPNPANNSYISLVPTQLYRALAEPKILAKLQKFTKILIGGAKIPKDLQEAIEVAKLSTVCTYGMAETCGGVVYDGKPLPGVRILTKEERVYLETPTAFSGYLDHRWQLDRKASAEVLSGKRVKTQDRGSCQNGILEIFGRLDDIVIIGGENIDLSAVRQFLQEKTGDPKLGGVTVVPVPDPVWGSILIAFASKPYALPAIQQYLKFLPNAALPRRFIKLDELPLTITAKIDFPKLIEIARKEWCLGQSR